MISSQKRYLGLELAGAKNSKSSLAAIEYYPREKKIFLLDVYDRISPHDRQSGDEALLECLNESFPGAVKLGVNVPLEMPPCVTCTRKSCPLPANCTVPSVKWMREITKQAGKREQDGGVRVREFTPYTQRPVELWVRYQLLDQLIEPHGFEVDETLGGNKAPLTARMQFLKRHLPDIAVVEVWPKLTVALLGPELVLNKRSLGRYRHLEEGVHARTEILEALMEKQDVFIYDRDVKKLSASLTAFDAFLCAYTALLSDLGQCTKSPAGFPVSSGWLQYPRAIQVKES